MVHHLSYIILNVILFVAAVAASLNTADPDCWAEEKRFLRYHIPSFLLNADLNETASC